MSGVNARRGEVAAELDGRSYRLCLTLGALAELESAFGAADLNALAERFSSGRLSAGDIVKLLGAGLRGAGNAVSDAEVAAMRCTGGAAGAADAVARLLTATFGAEAGPGDPANP